MIKTWCVGENQYSDTIKRIEYEKVNPKTKKLVKIIKKNVIFANVISPKILLSN